MASRSRRASARRVTPDRVLPFIATKIHRLTSAAVAAYDRDRHADGSRRSTWPTWDSASLERRAIPPPEIRGCIVGRLQELEQGLVGR